MRNSNESLIILWLALDGLMFIVPDLYLLRFLKRHQLPPPTATGTQHRIIIRSVGTIILMLSMYFQGWPVWVILAYCCVKLITISITLLTSLKS